MVSGLPATFNVNTTNATRETGEPNTSCASLGRTVWYNLTPGAMTQVTVSTVGSNFDTVLGVYTGNAVNALTESGAGLLPVTISAGGSLASGPRLQQLQIGAATNAHIDIPLAGLANVTGNRNVTLPLETRTLTFTVRHAGSGATTVPLTVVDGCGSWPTLVGGGANAF